MAERTTARTESDSTGSRHGIFGWVTLGALVASWDAWAALTDHETLSGAYSRALRTTRGRIVATAATAYLVAHLQGWPRSLNHLDPLNIAGTQLRRVRA